jgi:hypothetical protein
MSGNFTMIAERPLDVGDDVVHSYGDTLSSAQLLQTFGFVPSKHTVRVLEGHRDGNNRQGRNLPWLTPVCLHKSDHLARACLMVKNSAFPEQLRDELRHRTTNPLRNDSANDDDEVDDQVWFVEDIPNRLRNQSIPNEFLIPTVAPVEGQYGNLLLSEDMITFLATQFLPDDAYADIFPDDDSDARLDRSILTEDVYLGMLVLHSLLTAIGIKAEEYTTPPRPKAPGTQKYHSNAINVQSTSNQLSTMMNDETTALKVLVAQSPSTRQTEREIYGRTIRVEEIMNLQSLCEEIQSLVTHLNHSIQSTNKRTKL